MAAPRATTNNTETKIKYERISIPRIVGWYDPNKGDKTFEGRLLGWKKIAGTAKRESRFIVMVALKNPCKATVKGGKIIDLKPGQTLGVGVREGLKSLLDYVDSKPMVEVTALDKIDIGDGQTMWDFDVGMQPGARKNARPADVDQEDDEPSPDLNADDIPF